MVKMTVKQGCMLLYPDGSLRGCAGYVVDDESPHEGHALAGQREKLEPCAAFISADAAVVKRLTAPYAESISPPSEKKAKKKASKKKAKKKASW